MVVPNVFLYNHYLSLKTESFFVFLHRFILISSWVITAFPQSLVSRFLVRVLGWRTESLNQLVWEATTARPQWPKCPCNSTAICVICLHSLSWPFAVGLHKWQCVKYVSSSYGRPCPRRRMFISAHEEIINHHDKFEYMWYDESLLILGCNTGMST